MDEYQHMERFGMEGDFDDGQWINGEFYYRKQKEKRSQTRDDVLYGIFAESDSDGDDSSRKRRRGLAKKPDLTKPVNFVSTGTVMPNQEIDKNTVDEHNEEGMNTSGLGFSGSGLEFGKDGLQKRGAGVDEGDGENGDDEDVFLPTAFGQMIKEGAERRRLEKEKKKQKADKKDHVRRDSRIGDVGVFERHTKGIGLKLLEKMGYKGGGLGKNEQGIVAPIEAKLRPKNMGMGFGESKENKFSITEEQQEVKKVVPAVGRTKEKLWLKERKAKKKKEYITPEELLAEKEEEDVQFVQKVLDMRGPQVRVLTNLDNLNAEQEAMENCSFQPELQHNMRLIVDSVASDVMRVDTELRQERETAASFLMEQEKLEKELKKDKNVLDNMEIIVEVLDKLNKENVSGNLTLDRVSERFEELRRKYGDDYKLYNLAAIACSYAFPLLLRVFQGWDPLQNPSHGVELMRSWKNLLQGDDPHDFSGGAVSPYTKLSTEVILPAVRISGTNTWNARDPEPMMRFLELWDKLHLMPPPVLRSILDDVVMPKLSEAVETWDPRRERIPIHQWIHPWLPFLGQRLEVVYPTIRFKLGNVLHAWHPSDVSAYAMLSPWQPVFDTASWNTLIVRHIVPKLTSALHEFQVNPAHQELDKFSWVMTWASVIPIDHMVLMLETCFFPKWLQVLYHWLCSNPNIDEVTQWFLGWRDLFPKNLLLDKRLQAQLNIGLRMMGEAAEGLEVAQPGAQEHLSYLKVTMQRQEATPAKTAPYGQRDTGADPERSLKQDIETFALMHEVIFKPKFGRTHYGLQVYGFGSINICVDSGNRQLFAQTEEGWRGVSLEQVLEMHLSAVARHGH